jgi:hypothetical protein
MISQNPPTIGLIELPSLGLFNVKGKNTLSDETKGLTLVSKQILLSNLQAQSAATTNSTTFKP